MGSLFKRKDSKYWQATYTDASGRKRYASTGAISKREAQVHLAGIVAQEDKLKRQGLDASDDLLDLLQRAVSEARKGELSPTRFRSYLYKVSIIANGSVAAPTTLRNWVATWLNSKEAHISDSTMSRYNQNLHGILEQLGSLAEKDIYELAPEHLEAVMSELSKKGLRASTVNYKLTDLRSCLEEACNRGLIQRNVAKLVHKLPEEDSIQRGPFTKEEISKLLDVAGEEWNGFIMVAVYTGLRMSDIRDLRKKDLDLKSGLLTVQVKKRKRGLKPKIVQVPLAAPVRQWWDEFVKEECSDEKVFAVLSTLPSSTLSTQFKRLMERAGVPRQIELPGRVLARRSFHCLRHTFVSWLAESDVTPEIRKLLAGHSSDKSHQIYTHRSTDALSSAIDTLPEVSHRSGSHNAA